MSDRDKNEQEQVLIAFDPPVCIPGTTAYAFTEVREVEHGPFRFFPIGVSFQVDGFRGFAPWSQVRGVRGWEPPAPVVEVKKSTEKAPQPEKAP